MRLTDRAYLEVRITPLLVGIPGTQEMDPGLVAIDEADTTLLAQYEDIAVNGIQINEGRTATVILNMESSGDPDLAEQEAVIAGLAPLEQALWVGYWRPGEMLAETVFIGQCNVSDDFENGVVILDAADPTGKSQHHYIRRGDLALNIDKNRGQLKPHAWDVETIIDAARNTPEQQDRAMPGLGLGVAVRGDFDDPDYDDLDPIDFERGQEAWDEAQQILRVAWGPDANVQPPFGWPIDRYADLELYDAPTDPLAPGAEELGRNLDPADPDDPGPNEVVWSYGIPYDQDDPDAVDPNNIAGPKVEPGTPTTHQHVVDRDANYRETSADAESSQRIGAWVGWFATDFSINPPHGANTDVLRAYADANVKAYGVPPKFTTFELLPDDAQTRHFGHPDWQYSVPEGVEYIGGSWFLGDYARIRALRGLRYFSQLVRITGVSMKQEGSNGLLRFFVTVIPAIGGTPGPSDEEDADLTAPSVDLTAPADDAEVSGASVTISADAADDIGVESVSFRIDGVEVSGGLDLVAPYSVTWDTTGLTDGSYTITAVARDAAGKSTVSDPIGVTVDNGGTPPPPPPTGTLRVEDGELLDEDDNVLTLLTGGNVHGMYSRSAGFVQGIADRGGQVIRAVVIWSVLEQVSGVLHAASIANLDSLISEADAAGMHVQLELHLNTGSIPSWIPADHEPEQYRDHGQWITEALAYRYGNVLSPQYTSTVVGFGLNEIPLSDSAIRNGMNAIPYLEALQRTMIGWFRSEAPDWIGFVTLGYSNQTPYPAGGRTAASPTAYDSVGGNSVIDVHDYFGGCTNSDPTDDGRQSNGHIYPTYQGGQAHWYVSTSPLSYVDSATKRAQMAAYLADYVTYAAAAGMALMVGEFGWPDVNGSGKAAWEDAKRDVMRDANVAIALRWIISPSTTDTWASLPGNVWDPDVENFLAGI